MNLYFTGHQEKYAVEQTMLTLFPQERPVYPDPAVTPPGGDNALELQFTRRPSWCTARAVLRREGKVYTRMCRVRTAALPADDPVVATRLTRRTLQRAFYLAAIDCLGKEPPWGMLSGVRPVKLPTRAMEEGSTPRQAEAMLKHYHVSPVRRQLAHPGESRRPVWGDRRGGGSRPAGGEDGADRLHRRRNADDAGP